MSVFGSVLGTLQGTTCRRSEMPMCPGSRIFCDESPWGLFFRANSPYTKCIVPFPAPSNLLQFCFGLAPLEVYCVLMRLLLAVSGRAFPVLAMP